MATAHRVRDLVLGMGTWWWRTATTMSAGEVERVIADWAKPLAPPGVTKVPPVRRHRDGSLYVRRLAWRWGDHFRVTVQPASTGTVIQVEQRFYPPAWVLTVVLGCLAFRWETELVRRGDRKDFDYWLSMSVQAHRMGAWRRWRQAAL